MTGECLHVPPASQALAFSSLHPPTLSLGHWDLVGFLLTHVTNNRSENGDTVNQATSCNRRSELQMCMG